MLNVIILVDFLFSL
uniref:Uncharacterized protein n=1 Tax=Rhizophora mucronata TaxID=61149 RepID=A0A2P2QAH2_RHIMU